MSVPSAFSVASIIRELTTTPIRISDAGKVPIRVMLELGRPPACLAAPLPDASSLPQSAISAHLADWSLEQWKRMRFEIGYHPAIEHIQQRA